jgi:hypothetical protein
MIINTLRYKINYPQKLWISRGLTNVEVTAGLALRLIGYSLLKMIPLLIQGHPMQLQNPVNGRLARERGDLGAGKTYTRYLGFPTGLLSSKAYWAHNPWE